MSKAQYISLFSFLVIVRPAEMEREFDQPQQSSSCPADQSEKGLLSAPPSSPPSQPSQREKTQLCLGPVSG